MSTLFLSLALSITAALTDDLGYSLLTDLVVAESGDIYLADPGQRRIVCVSEPGNRTIATFSESAPIVWPGRLAIGPPGKLFVSDPRTHRIAEVDLGTGESTILAGTGKPGLDRDGIATLVPLSHPSGIAWDGDRHLAIADLGNRAVRLLDLEEGTIRTALGGWDATTTRREDGRFIAPDRFLPIDLAFTKEGALLVLDVDRRAVLAVDLKGHTFSVVSGSEGEMGDEETEARIANRRSFAIAPDGAMLFAEGTAGRITRLSPSDGAQRSLKESGPWTTSRGFGSVLPWPSAVGADAQGSVYAAVVQDAALIRIERDGTVTPLYRSDAPPPDEHEKALDIVRQDPDPQIVRDEKVRSAISATGQAWHVRHRSTGIDFVLVPPGRYIRGDRTMSEDARDNARPSHEVLLTKPIYVSRTEITNRQFRTLDPNHISLLSVHHDLSAGFDGLTFDGDEQPATNLSWYDASDFAAHYGFRLPTEAEWEYFARAGVETQYPWGDSLEDGGDWANLPSARVIDHIAIEVHPVPYEDGHLLTAPVGRFRPNGFGLHDVIGNVWEWCEDWYAADEYARCAGGVTDPLGPAEGDRKVLRGSSWDRPFVGSESLSFRGNPRPSNHFVLSRGARMVLDP